MFGNYFTNNNTTNLANNNPFKPFSISNHNGVAAGGGGAGGGIFGSRR